jgi:hypothetical protein
LLVAQLVSFWNAGVGVSFEEEVERRVLAEVAPNPQVLEAGGGRRCRIRIPGAHITVIDVDEEALALNDCAHAKIHGDIETLDLSHRKFDLVIFWDVLEHLKNPANALELSISALAPGALLLVKGPVTTSMKAIITRFSPHVTHVAFYRRILGSKNAGKPGFAPYRTEHATGASDERLHDILSERGFRILEWRRFRSSHVARLRETAYPLYVAYVALSAITRIATLGRYGGLDTDFWLLARKSG